MLHCMTFSNKNQDMCGNGTILKVMSHDFVMMELF